MSRVHIADRSTYWTESGGSNPAPGVLDVRSYWKIYYTDQNIAGNYTPVEVDHYVQVSGWTASGYQVGGGNSSSYVNGSPQNIWIADDRTYPVGLTFIGTTYHTVPHNDAGQGSFTWRGVGAYGFGTTTSTYYLPDIPRVSTISNNTSSGSRIDFGNNVTFSIDRKSSSFTHTLSYLVNGTTYTIGSGIATSTSYSFPTSLIPSFPSTATPTITVKCETYNGESKIGEANTTVYLNVPSSYVPTISLAISDDNTITSAWGIWVQGQSILKGIITASGVSGSSITNVNSTVEGQNKSGTSFTHNLTTSGTINVVSTATDSRGRQASDTKSITVIPYTVPTLTNARVIRCLNDGTPDDFGTYGKVVVDYTIASLSDNNAKSLKVKLGATEKTFTLSTYSGTVTSSSEQLFSGLAIDETHNFTFELTDSFTTTSQTLDLPPSYVLESDRAGGKGKTFGRIATEDGFFVYMESHFETVPNVWDDINEEWIPFVEFEEI